MAKTLYLFITLFLLITSNLLSQNTNKWGTNPKLNAPANNPALMGVFNSTQISGNYTMAYQPMEFDVTQQHTSNLDYNSRIQNSNTSIGGGIRYEKTYSNDFESAVLGYGVWLSIGHNWAFKNNTHFGVGLSIGHQYSDIQYFTSFAPGVQGVVNFSKTKYESKESLINHLGFSYYGEDFFISLSNIGLTGMYDIKLTSYSTLSPFGGISRLNYYGYRTFSYYFGLEFKPTHLISVGASWSNSFEGQELESLSGYVGYTFKKINLAYSASNNKIYFEQ